MTRRHGVVVVRESIACARGLQDSAQVAREQGLTALAARLDLAARLLLECAEHVPLFHVREADHGQAHAR